MIEMRWLLVPQVYPNVGEPIKTLQYRQMILLSERGYSGWSDWTDIPTVKLPAPTE